MWKLHGRYTDHPHSLLNGLGETADLNARDRSLAEKFVCKLNSSTETDINKVRASTFRNFKWNLDKLLTKDALTQHIKHANYRIYLWNQALITTQDIPAAQEHEWEICNYSMMPVMMTNDPVPANYVELSSCTCKATVYHCRTRHCLCKRITLAALEHVPAKIAV